MSKKSGVKKVQDKLAAQKKQFDFLDTQRIVTIGKLQQRIVELEAENIELNKQHYKFHIGELHQRNIDLETENANLNEQLHKIHCEDDRHGV